MRRLLTLLIPLALVVGACSDRTERPEVYPELPPTLVFRFVDGSSSRNLFLDESGFSADSTTHVDSVKVFDESGNLVNFLEPHYSFSSSGSNALPGWYFTELHFNYLNGSYSYSKTEITRNYLVHLNSTDIDSLDIKYRFTSGENGEFLAEYVKVYYNGQYITGSQMSNNSLRALLPK